MRAFVVATVAIALGAAAAGCELTASTTSEATTVARAPAGVGEPRISPRRIADHLTELESIAETNGGTRATGTQGYDASAAYVVRTLRAAGYDPELETFTTDLYRELGPATIGPLDGDAASILAGAEVLTMQYSPSGRATGPVVPVDVRIPPGPPDSSSSGCEPEDFQDFAEGAIALLQRGGCFLVEKALNAQRAGAGAVIVFNEGQLGRTQAILGTLVEPSVAIPVVGVSYPVGRALAEAARRRTIRVLVRARTVVTSEPASNVIAEFGGRSNRTVLVGAHLDSVPNGPGLNDNGSGVAAVLEIARALRARGERPEYTVRLAFWAAEELGLKGSSAYAAALDDSDRENLVAVLNLDMVGSANATPFVYDGDGSDGGEAGPGESPLIERLYSRALAQNGIRPVPTPILPNSDHAPFAALGIGVGGLFTGADGLKTQEEAAAYGGAPGRPYDACYHRACDTLARVDVRMTAVMARATLAVVRALGRAPSA